MQFNFTNFFKKIRYKFKKISVKLERNSDPLNETQKKAILIITKILMEKCISLSYQNKSKN